MSIREEITKMLRSLYHWDDDKVVEWLDSVNDLIEHHPRTRSKTPNQLIEDGEGEKVIKFIKLMGDHKL